MAFIKRNWILLSVLCLFIALGTLLANTSFKGDSYMPPSVASGVTRSLNSAVQISTTRNAIVSYTVLITSAATLVAGSTGQAIIETSPNNSTWTSMQTGQFGIASGLLITSTNTVTVTAFVPRGYWMRVRSNNVIGTPSYGSAIGIEVLTN
jgi:hypothetical protein